MASTHGFIAKSTIGAGGAAYANPSSTPGPSRNGANSTISNPNITTLTAKGGGGGGDDNTDSVGSGPTVGSGGGSWGGGGSPSPGSAGQPGTNSLYGATDYGFAGGARAAEHLRTILGALGVADVQQHVLFNLNTEMSQTEGFKPANYQVGLLTKLFDQVESWGTALKSTRG